MSTLLSTLLAETATTTSTPDWMTTLTNAITNIINPILILVATAGVIYAIVVGVKFVKADDKNERDEAKQKLISVIVGIVVTGILIVVFYWLSENIGDGQKLDFSDWWGVKGVVNMAKVMID